MWTKIIAGLFILSGVAAITARPDRLRRKLQKKGVRYIRRILVAASLAAGACLVSVGWQYEGVLPKGLTVVGIVVIIKAFFLLKAKSSAVIAERLLASPALYLRLFALGQIVLGILLLMLRGGVEP